MEFSKIQLINNWYKKKKKREIVIWSGNIRNNLRRKIYDIRSHFSRHNYAFDAEVRTQSITYHIRRLRHRLCRVHDSRRRASEFRVNSKRRYASRGGLTYSRLSDRVCVNAYAVGLVKYVNISGPSHAGRYPCLREIDESRADTQAARGHKTFACTAGRDAQHANKILKETGERFRRWNKSLETRISWKAAIRW